MTQERKNRGLMEGDPRQVGPFTIVRRLGQGGMGTVFLGRDPQGREVAVKFIHPQWASDPAFRRRFQREVAAAQRVARFCTAAVLGFDVDGEVAYMVTEYVPGPTLQDVVDDQGPLAGSSLEAVAVSVAVALQAIHSAGVVHSDLKPANVLLSPVGPKVIDFGVARVIESVTHASSAVVGTPAFMAPEQANGEQVTPASDIFAWGSLVAYAGSGRSPFGNGSIPNILYRVFHHDPDISRLEPDLRDIVARALSKEPTHRPSAQQLLDTLTGATPIEGVSHSANASPATGDIEADTARHPAPGEATPPPMVPPPGIGTVVPAGGGETSPGGGRRRTGLLIAAGTAAAALVATAAVIAVTQIGTPDGDRQQAAQSASSSPPPATSASPSAEASQKAGAEGNPLDDPAVRFYVGSGREDAARQAAVWAAEGRGGDAALLRALAKVPHSVWLDDMSATEAWRATRATLVSAAKQGSVPVFVVNNVPLSDCRRDGAANSAQYFTWVGAVAKAIGNRKAVIVLEGSNSLAKLPGTADCDLGGQKGQRARFRELSWAVKRLGGLPHTAVYLDGSFDGWPSLQGIASRLISAGVEKADGFFLNASSYQPTDQLVAYGTRLSKCIEVMTSTGRPNCLDAKIDAAAGDSGALPHFVIDTSRNGKGDWRPPAGKYQDPETWCNPPGRGVGIRPTTETGNELVDAYLWIRSPGRSNGQCTRGDSGPEDPVYGIVDPPGGTWWPDLALTRAKNAVPPLL